MAIPIPHYQLIQLRDHINLGGATHRSICIRSIISNSDSGFIDASGGLIRHQSLISFNNISQLLSYPRFIPRWARKKEKAGREKKDRQKVFVSKKFPVSP